MVDFLVKLKDVKAMEREDAIFECVLSKPLSKIMWVGKNNRLEQGEKYDITVSEDKLIHRLVVKDCMQVDKGIYAAVVGIKSCNAWLIVEGMSSKNFFQIIFGCDCSKWLRSVLGSNLLNPSTLQTELHFLVKLQQFRCFQDGIAWWFSTGLAIGPTVSHGH